MSTASHKTIAHQWLALVNEGNLAAATALMAPVDCVHRTDSVATPDARELFSMYRAALPDLELTYTDLVAEESTVMVRFIARGTHRGSFFGIAPTGRCVEFAGVLGFCIAGDRIADSWVVVDRLGLLERLDGSWPPTTMIGAGYQTDTATVAPG